MGITITDVKVVGICSKCRKDGDDISRFKNGEVVLDKDISCINNAFGKCRGSEKEAKTSQ